MLRLMLVLMLVIFHIFLSSNLITTNSCVKLSNIIIFPSTLPKQKQKPKNKKPCKRNTVLRKNKIRFKNLWRLIYFSRFVYVSYVRTLFSLKSLRIAFCALKFGSPAISCIGGRNKGQISHLLHPIVLLIVVSSLLLYNYMWLGLTFNSHSLVLFLLKHFQNSWNVYWLLFEVWPSFSIA